MRKNKMYDVDRSRDHIISDVIDVAKGAKTLIKDLGIGKITEGIIDLKLACGIQALKSMGYSVEQIRRDPLRSVLDSFGAYPKNIETTCKNAPAYMKKLLDQSGVTAVVRPEGNPGQYVKAPWNSGSTPILREVYGANWPAFGSTKLTPAIMAQFPPLPPGGSTPQSLSAALAQTSPEAYKPVQPTSATSGVDLTPLKPFSPMMDSAIREKGMIPPKDLEGKSSMFYDLVVKPATQTNYDYLDQSVVDAILTFVGSLAVRQREGEQLSGIYGQIATATNRIADKVEAGVIQTGQQKLGAGITDNFGMILIGMVALLAVAFMFGKGK